MTAGIQKILIAAAAMALFVNHAGAQTAGISDLEMRTVEVPEGGHDGTPLFAAIDRALADIPRSRLAGIVALTDGQVHDAPASPLPDPVSARSDGSLGSSLRMSISSADRAIDSRTATAAPGACLSALVSASCTTR